MTEQSLAGLVTVVTGAAGHLGSATARMLAARGAAVVVADVDDDRAAALSDELTRDGHDALAVALDVASEDSVATAFTAVEARFGGVDVLVNNAAPSAVVRRDAPAVDVPLDAWDAISGVVVRGALLCARQAIPSMIGRGGGSIVNIASVHGRAGDPSLTAYPVAKAALLGLTRTLATQYGRDGVRCNALVVGTIPPHGMSEELRASRLRHQLVDRPGEPDDVARLVAFLASPASSFVTGAEIPVEGGVLAHLPSYADTPITRRGS